MKGGIEVSVAVEPDAGLDPRVLGIVGVELLAASVLHDVLPAPMAASPVELAISFVGEKAIAELNATYRGIGGPTDVLSFAIDAPDGTRTDNGDTHVGLGKMPVMLGDVIICPAIAEANAALHGVELEEEITLLVVHGILHLIGMDHEEAGEAELMEEKERILIAAHSTVSHARGTGPSSPGSVVHPMDERTLRAAFP